MPRIESFTIADVTGHQCAVSLSCATETEGVVYYISSTYSLLEDGTGDPKGGGRQDYRIVPGDPDYAAIDAFMNAVVGMVNTSEGM